MIKNTTILAVLLFILMLLSFSACSGDGNSDSSSVSSSSSNESMHTETELVEDDLNSNSSQKDKEEEEESDQSLMVRIDADGGLRMRGGPGTEYEIIRVIPQHKYVQLAEGEEAHPNWVYAYYDGDYGWINTEYISYELNAEPTSDWAKVYYDYLSAFEAVTYTSTIYGSQHIIGGHVAEGEMRGCNLIEFWNVDGYDYPVLISNEIPIDADGNTDAISFVPTAYLIESGEVVEVDESNRPTFFKASSDGPGFDVKGNMVVGFVLKPENGGSPENVQEALKWLEIK